MTCPSRNERNEMMTSSVLLDYSAGRLNRAHAAEFEKHLRACSRCSDLYDAQAAVWDALSLWEAPVVSADFNRRLWQQIDSQALEPWYVRLRASLHMTGWKPMLPLAAAMIAVVAGFVMDHPGRSFPHSAGQFSIVEAEQVQQTLEDIQLLHQFNNVARPEIKQ